MAKIKYLFKRIINMNYKNFFNTIDKVSKKVKKPKIIIFFDAIICGIKYQAGYMDYDLFQMYNMNSKERKTILTRGKNNEIIKKYNNPKYYKYFKDKALFNKVFNKYLNRSWMIVDENKYDDFKRFIRGKEYVILKPIVGTHGDYIEKIKITDYTPNELYNYILTKHINLMEEVALQCRTLSKLHPYSINTVRIVTLKGKVVTSYLRIGNKKNVVDNFNSGGLTTPIDIDSGIIKYPAVDKKLNTYNEHPLTHEKIVGLKIPNWKWVKNLCEEASKEIPEIGYIGWDVCVGEDKPCLIEGNEFPGHDIYQLPAHRNGNTGIYPILEEAMKEDNK